MTPTSGSHFLLESAKRTLKEGEALRLAWKKRLAEQPVDMFRLFKVEEDKAENFGFLNNLIIDGQETSVMGSFQRLRFAQVPILEEGLNPLQKFAQEDFFRLCSYSHSDGSPAGLSFRPVISAPKENHNQLTILEPQDKLEIDTSQIGPKYDWTLF